MLDPSKFPPFNLSKNGEKKVTAREIHIQGFYTHKNIYVDTHVLAAVFTFPFCLLVGQAFRSIQCDERSSCHRVGRHIRVVYTALWATFIFRYPIVQYIFSCMCVQIHYTLTYKILRARGESVCSLRARFFNVSQKLVFFGENGGGGKKTRNNIGKRVGGILFLCINVGTRYTYAVWELLFTLFVQHNIRVHSVVSP